VLRFILGPRVITKAFYSPYKVWSFVYSETKIYQNKWTFIKRPTFYIPPYDIESRKKYRQRFHVKMVGIQNNKSDQIYTVSNCLNKQALTNIYVTCVAKIQKKNFFQHTELDLFSMSHTSIFGTFLFAKDYF
jgi:hypothetical protein